MLAINLSHLLHRLPGHLLHYLAAHQAECLPRCSTQVHLEVGNVGDFGSLGDGLEGHLLPRTLGYTIQRLRLNTVRQPIDRLGGEVDLLPTDFLLDLDQDLIALPARYGARRVTPRMRTV